MKCQVYPLKHQGQVCVMFPIGTSIGNLPKAVRHEIDTGNPWPQLDLNPGQHLGSLDESVVLMDISSDGFHIQHLNPGEEEMIRAA